MCVDLSLGFLFYSMDFSATLSTAFHANQSFGSETSLKKIVHFCLFSSLAHFLIGSFIFLELSCRSCLYIFEISCLSVASFAIIFSHSQGCLLILLKVSFVVQKLLIFNQVPFVYFCFYFQYSRRWVIEDPAAVYVGECFAYVLLQEFYSFWSQIQIFNPF